MTFEQLSYIVETWKTGTILAASQSLNVSPPAISKAISNLENELQVNIFTRTRAGTVVTPEGEQLIHIAQKILQYAEDMHTIASAQQARTIKIECHPQDIMNVMPDIVRKLTTAYPQVDFNISLASISNLLAHVRSQQIDFGIFPMVSTFKPASEEIHFHAIASTHLCIMVASDSPLCERPFVTPADLVGYQIVLPDDPLILSLLQQAFAPIDLPHLLLKTNDPHLVKQMVLADNILGTCPECTNRDHPLVKSKRIALLPLKCQDEFLFMEYFYVHHSKKIISPVEKVFLNDLKDTFTKMMAK